MAIPLADLTQMPNPQQVYAADGMRLATYSWGDLDAPTAIIVHGFASSTRDTWVLTGWARYLTKAGYRVLGVDQRGHGLSDKPHSADEYGIRTLTSDVEAVMDAHLIDDAVYVGYSLGARVGWEVVRELPHRIRRAVLGGVPDGVPLERLDLEQARAYAEHGTAVTDTTTQNYIRLAERVRGNDLRALLALAEGMRGTPDPVDPAPEDCPRQPMLFATGTEDTILEGSRALAAAAPQGRFVEIPGRNHFTAPGSRAFKEAAVAFLAEE